MLKKTVFFVLLLGAVAGNVQPNALTRNIKLDRTSPQVQLEDVLRQIRNTDITAEASGLLYRHPEETISRLSNLLNSKKNPNINEILDILNYNFDSKLLVLRGNDVQVDSRAFQNFLSSQARTLTKRVLPNQLFNQLVLYGYLQRQIEASNQKILHEFDVRKVPVARINALIARDGHRIAKRETEFNPFGDFITSIGISVCKTLINFVYNPINATLNGVVTFLDGVAVAGDENIISSFIALAVRVAKEVIQGVRDILSSMSQSICGDILNPSPAPTTSTLPPARKRRALEVAVQTRDVAFGNILSGLFDIAWNLISGFVNLVMKDVVGNLARVAETAFVNLLNSTVVTFLYGIIDAFFPSSNLDV